MEVGQPFMLRCRFGEPMAMIGHASSLAIALKPISRRQKPSGQSIRSTAHPEMIGREDGQSATVRGVREPDQLLDVRDLDGYPIELIDKSGG